MKKIIIFLSFILNIFSVFPAEKAELNKISKEIKNLTEKERKEILNFLTNLKNNRYSSRTVLHAFFLNEKYNKLTKNAKKIINDEIIKSLNKEIELFDDFKTTRNISKKLSDFIQTRIDYWKENDQQLQKKDLEDILFILLNVKEKLANYFDDPKKEEFTEETFQELAVDSKELVININNFLLKKEIRLIKANKKIDQIDKGIISSVNNFINFVKRTDS